MGHLGYPYGEGFFSPNPFPLFGESSRVAGDLALNVLRSLQFGYMLMKGFRSTSRVLWDLDVFSDGGMGSSEGRLRPCPTGSIDGFRGRIGSGNRGGIGRCRVRVSSRAERRLNLIRRARCAVDNHDTRASGRERLHRNGGVADSGEPEFEKKVVKDGNGPARQTGQTGGKCFIPEGDSPNGIESRVPAESALVKKFSSGMTNRTFTIAGLTSVDRISQQLKPMKGFMKSVKMATGVVSGVKTATGVIQKFQSPAGGALMGFGAANGVVLGFETARMIVKGAKISKDFAGVWKSRTGVSNAAEKSSAAGKVIKERFLKGLKASDGALTLLKLMEFGSGLGRSVHGGLSHWDLMSKSYDASNSVLKVFEAVLGLKSGGMASVLGKGFTTLKATVKGLGLSVKLVKAVAVSKEVSIVLLKGFGLSRTIIKAIEAIRTGKMMVKWMIFRQRSDSLDQTNMVDSVKLTRIELPLREANIASFGLLVICSQHSARSVEEASSSLMFWLAGLLLDNCQGSPGCNNSDEDGFTFSPSDIFLLSYPNQYDLVSILL